MILHLDQIEAMEAIVYGKFHDVNDVSRMDVDAVIDEIMALPSMPRYSRYSRETFRSLVTDIATGQVIDSASSWMKLHQINALIIDD